MKSLRAVMLSVVLVLLALSSAGCDGANERSAKASSGHGSRVAGGTATFALPQLSAPNYIFPLAAPQYFSVNNLGEFQQLMYRPLYWFGIGSRPVLNQALSLAYPPVWSRNGRSVQVRLKTFTWSDGTPVTARNVEFWQNLVTANKNHWGAYAPGAYPDNVVRTRIIDSSRIEFVFDRRYSHHWVLYNELSQITPLPLAWDKTCANCKTGTADLSPAGAKAVYKFLDSQARRSVKTYGTNPLWSIVDGPWRLVSLTPAGRAVFKRNHSYSQSLPPGIETFIEQPYATQDQEDKALLSGRLSLGYIPEHKIRRQVDVFKAKGYRTSNWTAFGINYEQMNQHNPRTGAVFRQAYFRQALQQFREQKADKYTSLTCGPIPFVPKNPYVTAYERSCPYRFNPAGAIAKLRRHGWHIAPSHLAFCARPGTKPTQCGRGIKKGVKLTFDYIYVAGDPHQTREINEYKERLWERAGIELRIHGSDFNTVQEKIAPCRASEARCRWGVADYGGWVYTPDFYPTGEQIFQCGGLANLDNYCDAHMDKLIRASELEGNDSATLAAYVNYATEQVPVLWNETDVYYVAAVKPQLHGVTFNPFLAITPEEWYLTR